MPGYDIPLILTLFDIKFSMFQEQVFLSMATSKLWMNLQGRMLESLTFFLQGTVLESLNGYLISYTLTHRLEQLLQ